MKDLNAWKYEGFPALGALGAEMEPGSSNGRLGAQMEPWELKSTPGSSNGALGPWELKSGSGIRT
jgi:hypothetical protein